MELGMSIDEIEAVNGNRFMLSVIPDSKSKFHPPFHLRHIHVRSRLLDNNFLNSIPGLEHIEGIGSVRQGGYYRIPYRELYETNAFHDEVTLDEDTDLFAKHYVAESPYLETAILGKEVIKQEQIEDLSQGKRYDSHVYLYCFNVGQGDSLLLITSEKNAYLIDTNIYNDGHLQTFCDRVEGILRSHSISPNQLKGLIITHKHCDHIRGASHLIDCGRFQIENFIINLDYVHPTVVVSELMRSARANIRRWINLNHQCSFHEGGTTICFRNPDLDTTRLAANINDSSIVMCLRHGQNCFYLTGDSSYPVLERNLHCMYRGGVERIIKVSHHGSRTGTSGDLLNMLMPQYAFISAGQSRRYQHPHIETLDYLYNQRINTAVSKEVRNTVLYESDGNNIHFQHVI